MMVVAEGTVFVTEVILGLAAQPHGAVGGWHARFANCDIAVGFQGGAINAARAYQQAGGVPLVMGLIAGADPRGELLTKMAVRQSIGVSGQGNAGMAKTSTIHARVDDSHIIVRTEPWMSSSQRLVMASMTARQAPLVHSLIETHPQEANLLLTSSQCKDPEMTIDLANKCALVQMDANDLEVLTGINRDVANGINCLRDSGVNQVIVTEGKRGITAFLDDEWHHQPSFIVEKRCSTLKCCDITFGTYLAARNQHCSIRDSLQLSAAATAMHLAGVKRQRPGMDELFDYANMTHTHPYSLSGNEQFSKRRL